MAQVSYLRQAAAIPFRNHRICLITSNSGRRWVIPKGQIEFGQSAGECALQEAWEEAGLVGLLRPEPVGSYVYEKWAGLCHVTVFRMDVTRVSQEWPERETRQRLFLPPSMVVDRIDEPGLADLLRALLMGEENLPIVGSSK